jgi:hypothetical protein
LPGYNVGTGQKAGRPKSGDEIFHATSNCDFPADMIFVEDNKTYELRQIEEYYRQLDAFYKKRAATVDPERQHILDLVRESGDTPIRITTVANQFARESGHHWKSRAEREKLKKQALRNIGRLIQACYLERYKRNWVRWVPPDNAKRKALVQHVDVICSNLPRPNI